MFIQIFTLDLTGCVFYNEVKLKANHPKGWDAKPLA